MSARDRKAPNSWTIRTGLNEWAPHCHALLDASPSFDRSLQQRCIEVLPDDGSSSRRLATPLVGSCDTSAALAGHDHAGDR